MKKLSSKDLELETNEFATKILACSNYLLGSPSSVFMPLITYKSIEKNFLKKMCEIEKKVLEPLFGKCHDNGKDEFGKSKVKVLETSRKVIEVKLTKFRHFNRKHFLYLDYSRLLPAPSLILGKIFLSKACAKYLFFTLQTNWESLLSYTPKQ